ncbi:MAG: hypothetical protein LBQ64_03900 [Bacteroidales bacterium]|nr:hypothetical protein [Bacteroidales bacterium]
MMTRTAAAVTAMGGTGYTFQSATAINFINPASYIGFDTLSFLIDASFSWKNHTLISETTQKGSTLQFDYLAVGLSVQRWWKTALGIQPYSIMNYTIQETKTIDTLTQTLTYLGEGGINEVYWGNAFRLFKNFSLGFNASFLFGTNAKKRTIEWEDVYSFNSEINNSNKVKGFALTLGMQYFIPVKDKGEWGIGVVYTPSIPVRSVETKSITTYWGTDYSATLIDSVYDPASVKHSLKMPTIIGGGISWSKRNKYFVGLDFTWRNWSAYAVDNVRDSLSDVYRISIGGSYTPNHLSSSVFPRMTFSLGANWEQTHLVFDGEHLNRFGINFGLLFPLKKTKTAFGLVLEYGQMGTTKNNLIQENYFTATINIRIHEKWYQRRKLD